MRTNHAWAAVLIAASIVARVAPARADEVTTDAEVQRRLEQQKVNLNLDGTPFPEALATLQDLTSIAFVMDRSAVKVVEDGALKAHLRLKDVSVKNALNLMLAASDDLGYEVWHATVFVFSKSKKCAKPPAFAIGADVKKALAEKKLTCNFHETPIADVAQFLTDSSGTTFSVADGINDRKLTLRVTNFTVEQVLVIACRALELTVAADGDKLELRPAPVGGGEAKKDEPAGAVWKKHDEKKAALEKKLAAQKVTLNFDDTPLGEVAQFLQDLGGVNVMLDKAVDGEATKVTVKLRDATVKAALDQVAAKARCRWEIVDGAVVFKKK